VSAADPVRDDLERLAEWEREALSSDRTRPRRVALGAAAPLAPCGCTSADDRECPCWTATGAETGIRVCLCLFHEPDENA
jgi:hypothetical protein